MRFVAMLRSERRANHKPLAVVIRLILPAFVVMLSLAPVKQPGHARPAQAHCALPGTADKNFPTKSVVSTRSHPEAPGDS